MLFFQYFHSIGASPLPSHPEGALNCGAWAQGHAPSQTWPAAIDGLGCPGRVLVRLVGPPLGAAWPGQAPALHPKLGGKRGSSRCARPQSPARFGSVRGARLPLSPARARLQPSAISFRRALPGAVIPAKAGIYSASHWERAADGLASRFRGGDQRFEGNPIPNDVGTPTVVVAQFESWTGFSV